METSVTPNMAQAMQGTEDVPNDPGYVYFKQKTKIFWISTKDQCE